ncbi:MULTISPECIES: OmpW/AlkL family protein [Pasteurellaceae]|uniref:OmpW/AlkL family protein n=1 Tax=Pasteurellaceae TaxID=712 RepID=UPI00050944CB
MKKTALALGMAAALVAGSVSAHEAGSVIGRLGGVFVYANSDSTTQNPNKNGAHVDVNLDVKNNQQLGLTATYMLTDNIGVELLGATPFSHKINAQAVVNGKVAAYLPNAVKVKQLPPSLYAQYYFLDKDAGSRPYIGAGLNYTRFFGAKALDPNVTNLEVKKHSFGPVVNAGIDIKLADNVYFNTAVWYTHIKTTAKFSALGLDHEVKIKLDPLVFFAGLAYRF